jgi:nucleoside-diphosphate-sugar epimerase
MRVLYVGGSGYVGGLVMPLLRQRFAVRVFDLRPPPGAGEYVRGDATDHAAVLAALADVDVVVHGAMAASDGDGADAAAAFGASVTSVYQALSAAHRVGVPHAVYLSSLSVYADPVLPTPPASATSSSSGTTSRRSGRHRRRGKSSGTSSWRRRPRNGPVSSRCSGCPRSRP